MKKETKVAISVLAIAIAFGLNITGLMPVLGMISEQYAGYDTSLIQLLQTLPYALMIVGSLMMGFLTIKFSKKRIIQAGILIIAICGVFPFFVESFAVLFASRLLIGFGFGISGPMNMAVISEFYPPEKRAGYMGLHVVGMGVGTIIGNLLGGILAGAGLRYFYLVYLLALLCFLIVSLLLPLTPPAAAKKVSDLKLSKMVYVLSGMAFIFTLFINAYGTNISMYITQKIAGDSGASGLATAVNAAFAMAMGISFGKVASKLKKATLPFSVFSCGVGYFAILFIPGMAGILIGSALCGVALSSFNAMASYLVSVSVEPDAVAKASGVFAIVGNIGGLIAPVVLSGLAGLLGGNTPSNQFIAAMGGILVFGIIISIYIGRSKVE